MRKTALLLLTNMVLLLLSGCAPAAPVASKSTPSSSPTLAPTSGAVFIPNVQSGSGEAGATATVPATSQPNTSPSVQMQLSATTVSVGQILTVTAQTTAIGIPYYDLMALVEGQNDPEIVMVVTNENDLKTKNMDSRLFEPVSAEGSEIGRGSCCGRVGRAPPEFISTQPVRCRPGKPGCGAAAAQSRCWCRFSRKNEKEMR